MAKVVCTVSYSPKHEEVRRTYHIEFDESDTIEINTTTKELALKVENNNAAAKKLVKRWKTQRIAKKSVAVAGEPANVFVTEHRLKPSTGTIVDVPMKRFIATFTMPEAEMAKFECGYYETEAEPGKKKGFNRYPGGQGVGLPSIP